MNIFPWNFIHNSIVFIHVNTLENVVCKMVAILSRAQCVNGRIIRHNNAKKQISSWWCHHMETFSVLLAICVGNSSVPGEFPLQRPVTWSFDVFFDLRLNKRLSKQQWGWWFETPGWSFDLRLNKPLSKQLWGWWFETLSHPLWHHCNVIQIFMIQLSLLGIKYCTFW